MIQPTRTHVKLAYTQLSLWPQRQVTKAEMRRLVEAFARKEYAIQEKARHETVMKLCDVFGGIFDKIIAKYPELDLEHNRPFLFELNKQAAEWWKSRAIRGAGIDW